MRTFLAGTCGLLRVVDQNCKVKGLLGLRVADASIQPEIVSGNTNASCIMIGERVAELIREEYGLVSNPLPLKLATEAARRRWRAKVAVALLLTAGCFTCTMYIAAKARGWLKRQ